MIQRTGYIIPYNFPLNTRRGFRTIYFSDEIKSA